MRVLIEASETYRNQTGIGRFSRGLISHLPTDLDVRFSPTDYTQRHHSQAPRTARARLMHFIEHLSLTQIQVASAIRKHTPHVVHSLNFFVPFLSGGVPLVATFFDMAYFDLPRETDPFWGRYGRMLMPVFAQRSSAVITTSYASKARISSRLNVYPEKIAVVYPGVDDCFRPVMVVDELERIRQKYALFGPFFLYAGAWHRPKNLPTLLRAFQGITDALLVITGRAYSAEEEELPRLAEQLKVPARFIGAVPDADLPALYTLAQALVLPSLYEGFGLPVVEAMACGTPVIVSDIPVLREISGEAGLSFPVNSPDALTQLLRAILDSPALREEQSKRALLQAARYRWADAARAVVEVWQHVAKQ